MLTRIAEEKDIPALVQMRWDFKVELKPSRAEADKPAFVTYFSQWLREKLQDPHYQFWIAEINQVIVSQVTIAVFEQLPGPDKLQRNLAILSNVYTVSAARGRKYAEKLILQATDNLKAQGVSQIILWPSDKAQAMYVRLGFQDHNEIMELKL